MCVSTLCFDMYSYIKYHNIIILCYSCITLWFFFTHFFSLSALSASLLVHTCCEVFLQKSRYYCILSRYVFGTFSCSRGVFFFRELNIGTIYMNILFTIHKRFSEKNIIFNCMSKIVWRLSVYQYNISVLVIKVSGKV